MTYAKFSKRERAAIAIATLTFIGASAIAHFVIGGFIEPHMHWATPAADQTPTPFEVTTVARASPTPTPVPTPTPAPRIARATPRAQSPAPHRAEATPPSRGRSTPEPGRSAPPDVDPHSTATPDARSSEIPVAIASATPNDAGPKPATPATFKNKVVPDYPSLCAGEGAGGSVTVDVTIDTDGSLAAAWVGQTSGFPCLDAAALSAAKESTYNPPEVGGRPIAETYLILYEFSIDS